MATKRNKQAAGNSGRTADGRFARGNPHAFKAGQSGNPSGRPPDTITPHLREIARELSPGKGERTYGRLVAEMLYAEALGGNVQAAREIIDRLEGKPKQAIDITETSADWRELARANGLNESDVIKEAQQLIDEYLAKNSDEIIH